MKTLNQYFIREHVGLIKFNDAYDIIDPSSQEVIGLAQEKAPNWIHFLRILVNKKMLPTTVTVFSKNGEELGPPQFSIQRGWSFLRPQIKILDANDQPIGLFRSKLFSIGGAFSVHLPDGEEIAKVKGNWTGWNFKFLSGEIEIGNVTKKWSGLGKELFTSADNYIINISGEADSTLSTLLLAAGLAIDTVLKEKE